MIAMKYFVLPVNKNCLFTKVVLAALILFLYACEPANTLQDENKSEHSSLDTHGPDSNDSLQFFKATGNEPFWSLEINSKKDILFHTPDSINFYTPIVAAQILETGVTKYEVNTEKGVLIVTLQKGEC